MSTSAPPPGQGLAIYHRLCAGDAIAPRDLCAAYLSHLLAYLEGVACADPHFRVEAAGKALFALIRKPQSYDPGRSDLTAYLRMAARRDLLNLLAREGRRQRGRVPLKDVEDRPVAGKYPGGGDELTTLPPAVLALLDEKERIVLELMCENERRTEVFAEALGLGRLSRAEQERAVKRIKDRIKARLSAREGTMDNPLEALARKAQDDDFFLGAFLAAYASSERLDDAGLAEALGCPVATLVDLRLCRAPREVSPGFGEDVDRISSHFGLAPLRLIQVVRRGRALMRAGGARAGGLFVAARDGEAKGEGQP